ncbi:DUF3293 domain-containing protein [Andreprevotia chitinilytica]|uniref:DUF3293 domain-containing protein n=1 Tax=Andreprevotia chitinilytica TaxID=396808 RepID=UPI000556147C|nr:DUF3293 domain-containing protein [Andreprevotia chitinilytica]
MHSADIQSLEAAYRATRYTVPSLGLVVRIGELHPDMDALLNREGVPGWAFVSAANPRSGALCENENLARHQNLLDQLAASSYVYFEGLGEPATADWTPELSVLILDIERDAALDIARSYEQNAIVYGPPGHEAELLWVK